MTLFLMFSAALPLVLPTAIQILLLPLAGAALWWCWRRTTGDRLLSLTMAGGILVRAVLAQILFWVSYFALPFGRSMQIGGGYWFFGVDGLLYFPPAAAAARIGLDAIPAISNTQPSIFFIRVLGVFAWLFGGVPSVAVLVNLFAYAGIAALVVRWGTAAGVGRGTIATILAFISFAPAWILWSLQPLKDSLFVFLIVLFGVLVDRWLGSWPRIPGEPISIGRVSLWTLVAGLGLYAVAGVRWYYAFIAMGAAGFAAVLLLARRGTLAQIVVRAVAMIAGAVVMTQAIIWGAGPYLPEKIHKLFRPGIDALRQPALPTREVAEVVDQSRANIDSYAAAGTRIRAGEVIAETESEAVVPGGVPDLPQTVSGRLIAGYSALLLPRWVASKMGLITVGGGRGLWLFVEVDTILFDVFLVIAVVMIAKGLRSGTWRDPFVWYLIVVTVTIASVLAYTISNFGTLFRHREMVVASLVLLVLAASRKSARPAVGRTAPRDDVSDPT